MIEKTVKNGVVTMEGFIPHLKHPSGLTMPVRTVFQGTGLKTMLDPPIPQRINGKLVYALPGGGVFFVDGS